VCALVYETRFRRTGRRKRLKEATGFVISAVSGAPGF
jgi:hypothetical protein